MEQIAFPALTTTRKIGSEQFHNGEPLGLTVLDFWRWSASDLVSNAMRGILAEFLVASALGLAGGVRTEWEPFDLLTLSGLKIEVKSAAYLQAWAHKKLSTITFGIRPTIIIGTENSVAEPKRQADVYVFCLLKHQDKATLDPLNVGQWEFYVLPASVLEKYHCLQKSLSLPSLRRLNPTIAEYNELASVITRIGLTPSPEQEAA